MNADHVAILHLLGEVAHEATVGKIGIFDLLREGVKAFPQGLLRNTKIAGAEVEEIELCKLLHG